MKDLIEVLSKWNKGELLSERKALLYRLINSNMFVATQRFTFHPSKSKRFFRVEHLSLMDPIRSMHIMMSLLLRMRVLMR